MVECMKREITEPAESEMRKKGVIEIANSMKEADNNASVRSLISIFSKFCTLY